MERCVLWSEKYGICEGFHGRDLMVVVGFLGSLAKRAQKEPKKPTTTTFPILSGKTATQIFGTGVTG